MERHAFSVIGFDFKGIKYTFEMDKLAQNMLYFSWLNMQNLVIELAVDFAYRIYRRTLFSHAIIQSLASQGKAWAQFSWLLAFVIARPGLYCETIASRFLKKNIK